MKKICETHLQEVLAGADEGELSAGAVRLRLAASNSLNQLRDLLCHSLRARTHSEQPQHTNGLCWTQNRGKKVISGCTI